MRGLFHFLDKRHKIILFASITLYCVFFGVLITLKYTNFRYTGMDLAIINQVVFNTSNGNWFASSIHPPTYLNDHFNPVIIPLSWLFSLYRHALTLLHLQNIALAIAAVPIFLIAKKNLGPSVALFFSLAWLLNPMVQNISMFEFHILPFALVFILFAFHFYQKNEFWKCILMLCLSLLVREDVSLVVFMFGVLAAIDKKEKKWVLAPITLSLLYFFFAMQIIGAFSESGAYKFQIYYSWLGNSPMEIVAYILTHPHIILLRFFSFGNIGMILGMLLPVAFLPILRPKFLLLAVPVYLQIFLGSGGASGLILKTQYATLFLPAIFIAFVYSLDTIKTFPKNKSIVSLILHEPLGKIILATSIVYASVTLGPVTGGVWKNIYNRNPERIAVKKEIISLIPAGVPVVAPYDLLAHLSSRKYIYSANYFFIGQQQFTQNAYFLPENTEYVIVSVSDIVSYESQYKNHPLYGPNYAGAAERVRAQLKENSFGLIRAQDEYLVYKKDSPDNENVFSEIHELPRGVTRINEIRDGLVLLGSSRKKKEKTDEITLYWKKTKDISDALYLEFSTRDKKNSDTVIRPMGSGLHPVSEWGNEAITQTRYSIIKRRDNKEQEYSVRIFTIQSGGMFVDSDRDVTHEILKKEYLGKEIVF